VSAPDLPAENRASRPAERQQLLARLDAAEAELGRLQRQLEHSGRLAALGTLAATIAHEFNNLLTPSMSYAQLALRRLDGGTVDAELIRKALVKAHSAGAKAGRICDAILNFARPDAGSGAAAASADVSAVVEESLATLGHDPAKLGIMVRCEIAPGLRAAIDPLHLEHVLVNLLINAREAMLGRRHGTLGLSAVPHAAPSGPAVQIEVSDTGRGIDPAHLGNIFDPFFTSRDSASESRGSGLGLNLCRQIVERCGGQITVQSTPGEGTTFRILLPAAKSDPASRIAA
jgi:two-component system NtrC family sensor kinase